MQSSISNILGISQNVFWILVFVSVVLFVFMIYVGICVVTIKNDLKKLKELEFEKYELEFEKFKVEKRHIENKANSDVGQNEN